MQFCREFTHFFGVPFTGLNFLVAYQKWQIWGMVMSRQKDKKTKKEYTKWWINKKTKKEYTKWTIKTQKDKNIKGQKDKERVQYCYVRTVSHSYNVLSHIYYVREVVEKSIIICCELLLVVLHWYSNWDTDWLLWRCGVGINPKSVCFWCSNTAIFFLPSLHCV